MITKNFTIINKLGLHARAAAKFVALASRFSCQIDVKKDEKAVNGKSIMGIMLLAANQNSVLEITAEGEDEEEALTALEDLIANRFCEPE